MARRFGLPLFEHLVCCDFDYEWPEVEVLRRSCIFSLSFWSVGRGQAWLIVLSSIVVPPHVYYLTHLQCAAVLGACGSCLLLAKFFVSDTCLRPEALLFIGRNSMHVFVSWRALFSFRLSYRKGGLECYFRRARHISQQHN